MFDKDNRAIAKDFDRYSEKKIHFTQFLAWQKTDSSKSVFTLMKAIFPSPDFNDLNMFRMGALGSFLVVLLVESLTAVRFVIAIESEAVAIDELEVYPVLKILK